MDAAREESTEDELLHRNSGVRDLCKALRVWGEQNVWTSKQACEGGFVRMEKGIFAGGLRTLRGTRGAAPAVTAKHS